MSALVLSLQDIIFQIVLCSSYIKKKDNTLSIVIYFLSISRRFPGPPALYSGITQIIDEDIVITWSLYRHLCRGYHSLTKWTHCCQAITHSQAYIVILYFSRNNNNMNLIKSCSFSFLWLVGPFSARTGPQRIQLVFEGPLQVLLSSGDCRVQRILSSSIGMTISKYVEGLCILPPLIIEAMQSRHFYWTLLLLHLDRGLFSQSLF